MLISVLTLLVALGRVPGDGTRLAPDPEPDPGPVSISEAGRVGEPLLPADDPLLPITVVGTAAAVLAAGLRRRTGAGLAPGDALALDPKPLVVFVPGHGSTGSAVFDDLIDMMDLEPEDYAVFDYRWVAEDPDHVRASQEASIDGTADALNAFLAGLAALGRPLYLVGHSKGGAGIAELTARWDGGSPGRVEQVMGAALLDPPISGGLQGVLQSVGRFWGPLPDDGGYDPADCSWFGLRCTDTRDHLGEASDVEVLVIRNPKAGITNFDDRPEGLRIMDVPDDGPGPLAALLSDPFGYPSRVSEAHDSVLHDLRVAECIVEEMSAPGSCRIGTAPED